MHWNAFIDRCLGFFSMYPGPGLTSFDFAFLPCFTTELELKMETPVSELTAAEFEQEKKSMMEAYESAMLGAKDNGIAASDDPKLQHLLNTLNANFSIRKFLNLKHF